MKTTVIQLETHDDLVSVRDKMSWAKTERILLVWPPRRKVNLRPLDLVLLRRHAIGLGAQLGLATRSTDMRRAAEVAGLPVFRTSSEAQKAAWPVVPVQTIKRRRRRLRRNLRAALAAIRWKEPVWMQKPAARFGFFTIGLLAVVVLASIFLPSAIIRVQPEREQQSVIIPVTISAETSVVTLAGALPAHELTVEVTGSDSLPASGKIKAPDKHAVGEVRFANLTETAVTIPEGTVILATDSTGNRFVTTKAGKTASGLGGIITLPVRSFEAGISGNLPANSLTTIDGDLGLLLAVTNEEPIVGGSVRESLAPSAADRSKLFDRLSDSLLMNAKDLADAQIPAGGFLLPKTLLLVETVGEVYDPQEGLAADALTLELHQKFRANYVSAEDLQLLGSQVLNASMPDGFVPVAGTLAVVPQGEPGDGTGGGVTWEMRASQQVERAIDHATLASRILGKSVREAETSVTFISKNARSNIEMFPTWWPWLPLLPVRISILAGQ